MAFSGKKIASQRIYIIESTVFENETAEPFSKRRREKYQKLLEQSETRIADIKGRIAELQCIRVNSYMKKQLNLVRN